MPLYYKSATLYMAMLNGSLQSSLHYVMFELTVRYLADDDQIKEWLPKVLSMQMIGNYTQTELGHGSNVRGLETTATLDMETDEWVINSPTITSTKWWPGDLGILGTHACVMA